MKRIFLFVAVIIIVLVGVSIFLYSKYGAGLKPVLLDPPTDIGDRIDNNNELPPGDNDTDFPLTIPDGFSIAVLARVPNARDIVHDERGNLWVSRPKDNAIARIAIRDGKAEDVVLQVFPEQAMNNPHGLAFDPEDPTMLYIAEEDKIVRVKTYTENPVFEKIVDVPKGGRHTTRSLVFADGQLLVSIGSTCDVCHEKDARHGSIMRVNREKKILEPYARGLRNAVFMAVHPVNGTVWATEMGRDFLGNTTPPDEINLIEEGKNYGWPICYGKNIHDTEFDKNTYIRNPCMEPLETQSYIDLPAHVAPLGLSFIPENGWPKEYQHKLVVAYHGSWNSTVPVGYKIVTWEFGGKANVIGTQDVVSGWLTKDNRALGRPVDVLALPGGVMYISDDKAGLVYRLQYIGKTATNGQKNLPAANAPCVVTGCSGEVCAEEETPSNCIYKEEFACYKQATCERQKSGQCGWTETAALKACLLSSAPAY